ncbi:hypothetical protein J6590_040450 [Homalodisca vitripennis]|nr:hypothetical protein J6590_040450 [Homalodisca vitripennis]
MTMDTNNMSADTLYSVGSLVFAKITGYPYWPAVIKEIKKIEKNIKYQVTFFGDNTTAFVKLNEICQYSECKKIHGKIKPDNFKNEKFNEALKLAEIASKNL